MSENGQSVKEKTNILFPNGLRLLGSFYKLEWKDLMVQRQLAQH